MANDEFLAMLDGTTRARILIAREHVKLYNQMRDLGATMILGWEKLEKGYSWETESHKQFEREAPDFFSDAEADLSVLNIVSATWDEKAQSRFTEALSKIWRRRSKGRYYSILNYSIGDYLHAALVVKGVTWPDELDEPLV